MSLTTMPNGDRIPTSMAIAQCRTMVEHPRGDDHAELITLREAMRQVLAILASVESTTTRLDGKW